jgi:hypothetical protein
MSASVAPEQECGQFIADLALALLGCHLQNPAMAKSYIDRAYANILRLSSHGSTIRVAGPAKIVRFVSQSSGLTETVLLPLSDECLLLPSIDITGAASVLRSFLPHRPIIHLTDVGITYHRLRLRTERLRQVLADFSAIDASPAAGAMIEESLAQCLHSPIPLPDPLDHADDYLTLALNLVRLDHCPLAAIALAKADSALRGYTGRSNIHTHPGRVNKLRLSLADLGHTLAASAS